MVQGDGGFEEWVGFEEWGGFEEKGGFEAEERGGLNIFSAKYLYEIQQLRNQKSRSEGYLGTW